MTRRKKQTPTHEAGSKNVYADLGFPDSDEMLVKAHADQMAHFAAAD